MKKVSRLSPALFKVIGNKSQEKKIHTNRHLTLQKKQQKFWINSSASRIKKIYSPELSKRLFTLKKESKDLSKEQKSFNLHSTRYKKQNSTNRIQKEQFEPKGDIQNKCEIIVHQNGKKKKFYYAIEKVKDLIEFLKQKENDDSIITYCTVPTNLTYDYYLSKQDHNGSFFNKKTLHLTPYHKQNKSVKVNIRNFQIIKCIGSGGFSKVFLVKFKEDGKFYAMKLIQKQFIIENKKQEIVLNQRNIMVQSNYPFLLGLKFSFESFGYIAFVLEYCPGGQLFSYVKQMKQMGQDVARFYIIQILLGIQYLHEKNVIYRDIKPENILLDLDGHVRIADFGLAKPEISQNDKAYSFCGSPEYMSPQMLLKLGHGRTVDFYCIGALLYQLLTGLPPYYNKNVQIIYDSVLNQQLTFPNHTELTSDCKKLIRSLLQKNPKKRLGSSHGVKQILAHPWFNKINKQQVQNKKLNPPIKIDDEQNLQFDFDNIKQKDAITIFKIIKQQQPEKQIFKKLMGNKFYYDYRRTKKQDKLIEIYQNNHSKNPVALSSNRKRIMANNTEDMESLSLTKDQKVFKKQHKMQLKDFLSKEFQKMEHKNSSTKILKRVAKLTQRKSQRKFLSPSMTLRV